MVVTGLPLHDQGHGHRIDIDFVDPQWAGRKGPLKAAQHGLHAGDQFARAEWFGDVIVGAEFKAEHAIGFAALGREKDHRDRGQRLRLPDLPAKFQAIFAGHHDVENEQRRPLPLGFGKNCVTGWVQFHHEAGRFQMVTNEARNVGIVFYHEDVLFHAAIVSASRTAT